MSAPTIRPPVAEVTLTRETRLVGTTETTTGLTLIFAGPDTRWRLHLPGTTPAVLDLLRALREQIEDAEDDLHREGLPEADGPCCIPGVTARCGACESVMAPGVGV